MKSMTQPRHSFAVCSFDNKYVYVFGGVTATLENYKPHVAQHIERYDF
jgi:hypothetical protein